MAPPDEILRSLLPTKGSRVHKTFLFTDIVQSTDIRAACIREFGDIGNQRYDDDVLAPHDEILERFFVEFNGTVVSTAGDSYFVAFDSAKSAVQCAVTIQTELINIRIPLPIYEPDLAPHLQIRIGLHTGGARELLRAGKPNYSDHTINIAARIEGFVGGEQVLMSEETWNNAGRLQGITKHKWEGYKLKGVDGIWTLVEALWDERAPREPQQHAQPTLSAGRLAPPFILPQLDVATFTGRVEELRRLEELLLKPGGAKVCSIVGLSGGGGIGKTALACHFASVHRDAFPDGVIGLRVDGKNNDTIAREFAWLCGEEITPDDERQSTAIMQDVFGHRRMLLLFDNAEDAAIQVLRPGGRTCAVIITTRDRQLPFLLGVSEDGCIDLPPLPPPDARLLLENLIGSERTANEPEAIEEISKLIGNLPLALQIVGAMLHLQSDRNIGDYAVSLRAERKRLEKLKVRGASHLDVFTSFTLSLRLLTDEEINFFACQSVCAQDGFSLQAAVAAGACNETTAYERLSYLYRLSLLNRPRLGAGRYVFHPLIRLFAQELSAERSLQVTAAERHARYFIQLVKISEVSDHHTNVLVVEDLGDCILASEWLQQRQILDYEFVTSLEHFLEQHSYWQQASNLMAEFFPLAEHQENWLVVMQLRIKQARYLSLLGDWMQAEQTLVLVAEIIDRVEDHESRQRFRAVWFSTLGGVWQKKGLLDEAADAFRRSALIDEQRGDRVGQAMALNRLGSVLQRQGHFDGAVDALRRSLAISEDLGDKQNLAIVLTSLGGVLQRQGHFDEAVEVLQRSLAIFEELGEQRSLAMVLNSLGGVLRRQGHLQAAVQAFRRSAEIEEKIENRRGLAIILTSLGGVLQRQGHFDEAVEVLQRSLAICEELGEQRSLAMVLNSLGGVLRRQGHLAQAADRFKRSYDLLSEFGDRRGEAIVLTSLGGVLQRQGHLDEAAVVLRRSAAIEEEINNKPGQAKVLTSLSLVLQQQGYFDEAIEALQYSAVIEEQSGNQTGLSIVLGILGSVLARQGNMVQAIDAFKRSVKIDETLDDKSHLAMVHRAMGKALLQYGDVEQAATELSLAFTIGEHINNRRDVSTITPLLVHALTKLGRRDEAHIYCQRALAVMPEDARLRELRDWLQQYELLIKQGVIKRIIPHERGYRYGFITHDDGSEIYFQERDVHPAALPCLVEGARVEFEVRPGGKGPQAMNVRII